MIGGGFAVIFRTELAAPGFQFLTANTYNTMFSMHGWVALASILLGIGALANYLVPLMIGAEDMAFPRLNAFAYWINVPAIVDSGRQPDLRLGWRLDRLSAAEHSGFARLPVRLLGDLLHRPLVDLRFAQPDCHDPDDAPQGHDPLPHADLRLGRAGDQPDPVDRHPVDRSFLPDALVPAPVGHGLLRPGTRAAIRFSISISSGSTPTRQSTSLCCPAWASSARFCRSSLASRSSAIAGLRCPAWRLPWSASWSGAITCLPPATRPTCVFRS